MLNPNYDNAILDPNEIDPIDEMIENYWNVIADCFLSVYWNKWDSELNWEYEKHPLKDECYDAIDTIKEIKNWIEAWFVKNNLTILDKLTKYISKKLHPSECWNLKYQLVKIRKRIRELNKLKDLSEKDKKELIDCLDNLETILESCYDKMNEKAIPFSNLEKLI